MEKMMDRHHKPKGTVCDTCGRYFAFTEFAETIEEFLCEECASGIDSEDDETAFDDYDEREYD